MLENNLVFKREEVLSSQKIINFLFTLAVWSATAFFKEELKYLCIFGIVIAIDIVVVINATQVLSVSHQLFPICLNNGEKLASFTIFCKTKLSFGARMRVYFLRVASINIPRIKLCLHLSIRRKVSLMTIAKRN